MSYELNGSDFSSEERVNPLAVGTVIAGLGVGAVFWGMLFFIVAS